MPPSPVDSSLRGWSEKQDSLSNGAPIRRHWLPSSVSLPMAQAASSTSGRPWRLAIAATSAERAGMPSWWTSMMAPVLGVMAASIRAGSMLRSSSRISTNTGSAPQWRIALAVAMKEWLTVMTSCPGLTPLTSRARCSETVQFETATACRVPQNSANSRSKAATSGPWVTQPERRTRVTASSSSRPKATLASGMRSAHIYFL